ncbi:hypothetical protein HN51_036934 [Arachis hypogaea]|uniref:At3g05675-like ankyrin-like domain-containing protein n=1 Tax=Arachis hypogaea TaxID=3818 RepID=A0A444ZXV6_ARAHY|nr:BTB/POZ domain-containing protein At2g13690 [Arachis hypogaea]QHO02404.1 BTB/POZ domain-containing protein [Arachis hypogaea]RYR19017.1 hypothetical protein Ahy_B03g063681 [Arachis hypogaea]
MDYLSSRRDRKLVSRRRTWCCSFTTPPASPENSSFSHTKSPRNKTETLSSLSKHTTLASIPNSPKSPFPIVSRIDPRRILSPGRVSPIDSDPAVTIEPEPGLRSASFRAPTAPSFRSSPPEILGSGSSSSSVEGVNKNGFDVRLTLRGKRGSCMVLEVDSGVLSANSEVFADLVGDYKKGLSLKNSSEAPKMCRMEVPAVENLGVFRDTIELMFEDDDDVTKKLIKVGVYRSIDILEVSAGIMFNKGVLSCLKYLEAVPWTEEEEEKLRSLFTRFKFDDATARDILARLYLHDSTDSQFLPNIARQLVWSISTCEDANARIELKSLMKGLLCKSSVYGKNHLDISKEDLYAVCRSCLASLVSLFEETSDTIPPRSFLVKKDSSKTLIERISRQVDNINWLLEIMLDGQVADDFVNIWADQQQLVGMHENASPMIRYELSRVSAILIIAMATRKLQCRLEARSGLLQSWFRPMLLDFGWLQRCRKGLDMKAMEEAMGQTLLTLPLKQQHVLFMVWFRYFSSHGTECPNLSKAFQIWWRRSFLRGCETYAIESR